jgi:outer membrane protein TolC
MARALTLMVLLLAAGLGQAQTEQTSAPPYDLPEVLRLALERHASLRAGESEVAAAQARIRQVTAHFRPQFSAEAGYIRLEEQPSLDVDGMGAMTYGSRDNWLASLGLEYPLSTGGKLEGMRSGAEAAANISRQDLERRRQTAAINAARAFFRLLEANRMSPVVAAQVTALEEAVRSAEAMQAQGVAARIDVLRAQVALTGARQSLEQLRAGQEAARTMLAETMGLPPGSPVDIIETEPETAVPEFSREQWTAAWESRPELRSLAARRRALEAQLRVDHSARRPQLGLFAKAELERATAYPDTGVLSGGVVLRQSLGDGGASRAAEAVTQAQLEQLAAMEEQAKYGIAVEVQVAISGLLSARSRVAMTAPAVDLAREALRLVQVGYANGVTPMTDVLDAQAALTRAGADYEGALSALRQARAEYEYAMGSIGSGAAG